MEGTFQAEGNTLEKVMEVRKYRESSVCGLDHTLFSIMITDQSPWL